MMSVVCCWCGVRYVFYISMGVLGGDGEGGGEVWGESLVECDEGFFNGVLVYRAVKELKSGSIYI